MKEKGNMDISIIVPLLRLLYYCRLFMGESPVAGEGLPYLERQRLRVRKHRHYPASGDEAKKRRVRRLRSHAGIPMAIP